MAEKATGKINLVEYNVDKTIFERIPVETEMESVRMKPTLTRKIQRLVDSSDTYRILLSAELVCEDETNPQPFRCETTISGIFQLDNIPEDKHLSIMEQNATAIMYPYLRTHVSILCSLVGLESLVLPVINVSELFVNGKTE